MSTAIKNVTLVGASGAVGSAVLPALEKAGFNITILSRKESTATFPDKYTVKKVDYESGKELEEALKGQDAVVATITTLAVGGSKTLIDASIAAGVKRFIPSEFGLDSSNPTVRNGTPIISAKGKIVDYLKSKESTGLTWSGLITGAFFDWGLKTGFLGIDTQKQTATIVDLDSQTRTTFTLLSKIGAAVASILKHPEETKNRYVYTSSFVLSGVQLVEAIEKVTGKKYTTTSSSSDEIEKAGKEQIASGNPYGGYALIQVLAWRKGAGGDYALTKNDNRLLELPEDDLDETLKSILL